MKTGKLYTTLVMMAIAAAVAVYFGFYVFHTFNAPYTTTFAYPYTVNDSEELAGLLVRQEQLLPTQGGMLDLILSEGERVGAGQTVALVYQDSGAQDSQAELEKLALEIELLTSAVHKEDVESAARLDENILQSVVALRASTALGDYSRLEDQVIAVKSSVLKRGYTYGSGLTAADLSAQLKQLRQEYDRLDRQTSAVVTRVTAPQSGTFSSLVDGYESLLDPRSVFDLTPSGLNALLDNPRPADTSAPGKLITGFKWYYAANLSQESAKRLKEGSSAHLRFTGDFDRDMDMQVEQIGPRDGEKTLVIFSSDRYLAQTTLLRHQQAELIFDDFTGLRIPKEAMRMEKTVTEDETTGQTDTHTKLGVYALVSGRVEFKGVEVAAEGSDYYVVRPTDSGRKILRAGDEIIVRGTGLYEGQLLEF